jgi:NAD(P)-dependent dehydrogenase (short-subunit alcohol dehydrogenase family)
MKLANKVALITGGNSGIGFATARLFVAEGARVAITGRNPKTLQAAAKELGQNVLALPADVTDIAATERVVDTLTKQWGKLDILFANAGFHALTPIGQTSVAQFEEIIRTNLTGVFFTIQAAAPHLNDGASIILNGSVQAVLGIPGFTAYAAAKGGIRTMTRNLASEFAPRKIRVNQVTPGATRTPIWSLITPTEDAERESWSSGLARPFHSADSARPMKSRKRFCTWLRMTRPFLQALKSWLTEEQPELRMEHLSSGTAEMRFRAVRLSHLEGAATLFVGGNLNATSYSEAI